MKKLFTEEDILRFLYNEMSIRESEAFLDVLYSDEDLWEKFEYFQQTVDTLRPLDLEPSEESLEAVLSFVQDTQPTGQHPKELSASFPTLSTPARSHQLVMMAVVLLITSLVISGSLLFVSRNQNSIEAKPLGQNVIEETQPAVQDWDGQELNLEIERIKEGIERLKTPDSGPINEK